MAAATPSAETTETAAATEMAAEDITELAENIFHREATAAEAAAAETAGPGTHAFMAKLVVTCFLVGVAQYIVCFGSLFELFFGILIAGIFIGMEFKRRLAVCLLDLVGTRPAVDAKHLIVVSFRHNPYSPTTTFANRVTLSLSL